jgi:DNA-binding PadR family transcriptional regulator
LSEFKEMVLLIVGVLGNQANGLAILRKAEGQRGRAVHVSVMHPALYGLVKKGFLPSSLAEAPQDRGGKSKRVFTPSPPEGQALRGALDLHSGLFGQVPQMALAGGAS